MEFLGGGKEGGIYKYFRIKVSRAVSEDLFGVLCFISNTVCQSRKTQKKHGQREMRNERQDGGADSNLAFIGSK